MRLLKPSNFWISWRWIFKWSKILVCVRVCSFLLKTSKFGHFMVLNFPVVKSSYVSAWGDFFLKTLFLLLFRDAEFSSGQNPRMCMRAGISFWKPYFYCYFVVLNFPVFKILVCARVRGFLFENLIFTAISWCWIFQWSKSSYVHACGDFFWKPQNLNFLRAEFSSGQNPRMCTREGFFWKPYFYCYLVVLNFLVVKILVCARVWGFLFENLIFTVILWCWIFQWSNFRMCTSVGISFWKSYFYCYFVILNFPVIKILVCARVRGFLFNC